MPHQIKMCVLEYSQINMNDIIHRKCYCDVHWEKKLENSKTGCQFGHELDDTSRLPLIQTSNIYHVDCLYQVKNWYIHCLERQSKCFYTLSSRLYGGKITVNGHQIISIHGKYITLEFLLKVNQLILQTNFWHIQNIVKIFRTSYISKIRISLIKKNMMKNVTESELIKMALDYCPPSKLFMEIFYVLYHKEWSPNSSYIYLSIYILTSI